MVKKATSAGQAANGKARPVLITTAKRGVFFGYADDVSGDTIDAKNVRMVVYWSTDTKGIIGLAASGPTKNCRVTAAAPAAQLREVTAVFECSDDAVKAFEAAPWG